MQTKEMQADILISGAGPAGLTLAALLGQIGFAVILLDAETPVPIDAARPSGRTAALLNGSINVVTAAGVWDALVPYITPLKIMKIIDDSLHGRDPVTTEFVARDLGKDQFGFNVPNARLKSALVDKITTLQAVTHMAPCRLSGYKAHGQSVIATTENGLAIRAKVIVGTDGRGSVVRAIAAIEADKRDYEQTAMTCLISHSKDHHFVSTEFHRSGGPFTFVPMPGRQSSVVWVEKTADAKKYLSLKKTEFEQALQDRSHGVLGTITLASSPESWPLMTLNAHALAGPRAVLAAEAAHVLSPIGAQGLNLSLRDVATLAETLTDAARLGEDIGCAAVLARYERRRQIDIRSHVTGIDHYNRAIINDAAMIKDLRRLGWKSLKKVPALKQFMMHQGLAPDMDQGRLLSGAAL